MIRFLLAVLFLVTAVHAEEMAKTSGSKPAPQGVKDDLAANPACLSAVSVATYSRSQKIDELTKKLTPKPDASFRARSLKAVRLQLEKFGLTQPPDEIAEASEKESDYDDEAPQYERAFTMRGAAIPQSAKDAGEWLANNQFVNLMNCPTWAKTLSDPNKVPKGAVVVYEGGRHGHGHIEIKTPSGFWSDRPRKQTTYSPRMKVIGVYVKGP